MPFGKYGAGTGMVSSSQGISCDELNYCYPNGAPVTSSTQASCAAGTYCPLSSILENECRPGTYSQSNVATSTSSCENCPAEYYCPNWGMTTSDLSSYSCYDGYLCLGGAIHPSNLDDVTIRLCPKGSYCKQSNTPTT